MSEISIDSSQPSFSHITRNSSESIPIQITTIRLSGDNFLRWSQSVRMYLRGRGKIGYITGDAKEPAVNDPAHAIWDSENSMVMTWLVNSMTEEIGANYLCFSTAKDLWESVSQMYSDLGNQSQVYELTLRLGEIRQGEDSVTKYFHTLKRIWQDLDLFNDYEWKSVEDGEHYKKMVDISRIFKFLAGLNVEFDEVRGQIIGRSPLPLLGEVFAEVRREESRRSVMLGKRGGAATGAVEGSALAVPEVQVSRRAVEGSALAIPEAQVSRKLPPNQRGKDKDNLKCDYCGKTRHTRETCYKLHGRPSNFKGNRNVEHSSPAANEAESSPFNKEQLDQLLKLLKTFSTSNILVGSMVHSSSNPMALSSIRVPRSLTLGLQIT